MGVVRSQFLAYWRDSRGCVLGLVLWAGQAAPSCGHRRIWVGVSSVLVYKAHVWCESAHWWGESSFHWQVWSAPWLFASKPAGKAGHGEWAWRCWALGNGERASRSDTACQTCRSLMHKPSSQARTSGKWALTESSSQLETTSTWFHLQLDETHRATPITRHCSACGRVAKSGSLSFQDYWGLESQSQARESGPHEPSKPKPAPPATDAAHVQALCHGLACSQARGWRHNLFKAKISLVEDEIHPWMEPLFLRVREAVSKQAML